MANVPVLKVLALEIEGPEGLQVTLDAYYLANHMQPTVRRLVDLVSYLDTLERALRTGAIRKLDSTVELPLTDLQKDWLKVIVVPLMNVFISPGFLFVAPEYDTVHMYNMLQEKGEAAIPMIAEVQK